MGGASDFAFAQEGGGLWGGGLEKWRQWFCFAVLSLGLSPEMFWRLPVLQWQWLLLATLGAVPGNMDLPALQLLTKKYPDKELCQKI